MKALLQTEEETASGEELIRMIQNGRIIHGQKFLRGDVRMPYHILTVKECWIYVVVQVGLQMSYPKLLFRLKP